MILRATITPNPARQRHVFVSTSSGLPYQTNYMKSSSKMSGLRMQRDEPDESTDQYYKRMINDNPGNALLLGNYARFLKEVRGDMGKAEEYCKRAILAKAGDGNILSLYAEIIWQTNKDTAQAEGYFHQAVFSQPDNSYILASYARFLWDAEEKDGDSDSTEFTRT